MSVRTATFPGRIEKRRKLALERREANLKTYNSELSAPDFPEDNRPGTELKRDRAASEIVILKKILRLT